MSQPHQEPPGPVGLNMEETDVEVGLALPNAKKDFSLEVSRELAQSHCCPLRAAISESVPSYSRGKEAGWPCKTSEHKWLTKRDKYGT